MTKKECEKNCSNCKKDCSSCRQYQEKAFELEVDEEIEQERLTQIWQKYRSLIIGGVAGILILTAGFQIYHSWWNKVRLTESDLYEQAVILANSHQWEKAQASFTELSQSAHSGYKTLALLELSDVYMQQGQTDSALKTLKNVIDTTKAKDPLHHVAVISYTGFQIESADPQEMLTLLQPTIKNKYFQGLATEIAVLYLKRMGQKKQAQDMIQDALTNATLVPHNRARLQTLSSMLEE